MQRFLFVDDEPKLLNGLRRMLHSLRSEWAMEFVESGPEALQCLAERRFDVVVSDMRMPGMDGSELLRNVRERFPTTVRLILSGQCDRRAVLKAIGPAHQFLTKPCNSETLKGALSRACRLGNCMSDPEAQELASRVEALPSLPESLGSLTAALEAAEGCMDQAGRVVAGDPGMAARVLQLVNSGYFGSPQPLVNPRRAAGLLGQERLSELAAVGNVFIAPPLAEPYMSWLASAVDHCRTVAEVALRIAQVETNCPDLIADARWGGLLHDVGRLVLIQQVPGRYADLLAAGDDNDDRCTFERQTCGADHAALGAYLLSLWGLPDSLVRIAAMHHTPAISEDCGFTALTAVHAANALCRQPSGRHCKLDNAYLERIGKADRVSVWAELCRSAAWEGATA